MFPPDSQPLLVLVNSKSGGGQGADMLAAFQRLLNPHQVHSLADGGPLPGYALLLVALFCKNNSSNNNNNKKGLDTNGRWACQAKGDLNPTNGLIPSKQTL